MHLVAPAAARAQVAAPTEADRQAAIEQNALGCSLLKKDELDKAIEAYGRAIRLDPALANAYFNRGFVWYKKREYHKAIEDLTRAVQLNANDAGYYNIRGLAWDDKGDHDKAIADYSQAIQLNPNLAVAYNNRGLAWAEKGCRDKAAADYEGALRLDPTLAVAQRNLSALQAAPNIGGKAGNALLAVGAVLVVAAIVGAIVFDGPGRVRSIGVLLVAGGLIASVSGKNSFESIRNGIFFGVPLFLAGLVAIATGEFPQWFLNFVQNVFDRRR